MQRATFAVATNVAEKCNVTPRYVLWVFFRFIVACNWTMSAFILTDSIKTWYHMLHVYKLLIVVVSVCVSAGMSCTVVDPVLQTIIEWFQNLLTSCRQLNSRWQNHFVTVVLRPIVIGIGLYVLFWTNVLPFILTCKMAGDVQANAVAEAKRKSDAYCFTMLHGLECAFYSLQQLIFQELTPGRSVWLTITGVQKITEVITPW